MKKIENCKSVKWVLLSLNLEDYSHVCVREHGKPGFIMVGGGRPGDVIRRFGNRLVTDSHICDNVLYLYVVPLFEGSDHWGDWCMLGERLCACAGQCCICTIADGVSCPLDRGCKNGV